MRTWKCHGGTTNDPNEYICRSVVLSPTCLVPFIRPWWTSSCTFCLYQHLSCYEIIKVLSGLPMLCKPLILAWTWSYLAIWHHCIVEFQSRVLIAWGQWSSKDLLPSTDLSTACMITRDASATEQTSSHNFHVVPSTDKAGTGTPGKKTPQTACHQGWSLNKEAEMHCRPHLGWIIYSVSMVYLLDKPHK